MSLPKSYYETKRLVSMLGLDAKKIDCCVSGCILFYDNDSGKKDAALLECKIFSQTKISHTSLGIKAQKTNCS